MEKPKTNNKKLRETSTKVLLNHVFDLTHDVLPEREHQILEGVILHERTFETIGQKLHLSGYWQSILFKKGFKTLLNELIVLKEKANERDVFAQEIKKLKKVIKKLKNLPDEEKEIPVDVRKIMLMPIEETNLTTRVKNMCKFERIKTVGELCELSKRDFLSFRNCGRHGLSMVEDFFREHNLKWGMF